MPPQKGVKEPIRDSPEPEENPQVVPLFDETTALDIAFRNGRMGTHYPLCGPGSGPALKGRQFQAYDHYLPLYWEYRTVAIGARYHSCRGSTITFDVTTVEAPNQPVRLRFFYLE